jgi:serine/threonine protein kinase
MAESSSTPVYDIVRTNDRGRDQGWAAHQSNATASRSSQVRTLRPDQIYESRTLSRMRQEKSLPHAQELDRLVQILKENQVPGPQLFRMKSEFSQQLGNSGGQGTVYGISKPAQDEYKEAGHTVFQRWRVNLIAIKQYKRARTANQGQGHDQRGIEEQLSNRFRDAACEAFALSPSRFRNHPNIVQLRGWGLCLDTLENPASQCCSSLQVPMLILEKADMNLAQFLQRKHPAPRRSIIDVESGSADTSPDAPSAFKWLASAFAGDSYEIIRLLCIDIGHGLSAIHHHEFSHGDLKPENILVFRPGTAGGNTKWVAKICDFGLSSGGDDPSSMGQRYTGTKVWQPPEKQIKNSLSAEDLRKCDVYVYGLVVLSAFLNEGKHCCSLNAEELNKKLESLSRRALRDGIKDLVKGAMKELGERDIEPWKCLYTNRESRYFENQRPLSRLPFEDSPMGNDWRTGSWFYWPRFWSEQPPLSRLDVVHVSRAERQGYNNKHWWKTNNMENDSDLLVESNILADGDVRTAESTDRTPTVDPEGDTSNRQSIPTASSYELTENLLDGESHRATVPTNQLPTGSRANSRVVSLVARDVDDWPLSTDEFTSERRKVGMKEVLAELLRIVAQERWRPALGQELYFCARYRSRMKYTWWSECAPETNVLGRALNLVPTVDICTLAWLAKGKIGNFEATNLAPDWDVWGSILDYDKLDESERLS